MTASRTSPPGLLAARVVRAGKFWALEPLFADLRSYPVARGGRTPHLDDIVLAVPAKRNRLLIVEVLGPSDDMTAVLKALLVARGVRQGFDDDVLDEARVAQEQAATPDEGRRDLSDVPTFTIDPDTARDFDDAISCRSEPGGGYRVWVHIADVSHFVPSGSAIDAEARRRTSSVYLPLWAEPMLPEQLSSGACSLQAGVPRLCVSAEFVFDAAGKRESVAFCRSTIVSDHRLTYGFVDEVLAASPVEGLPPVLQDVVAVGVGAAPDGDGSHEAAAAAQPPAPPHDDALRDDAELRAHLLLAAELAGELRRARFARGALQIGSFEPEYRFDERGQLVGALERLESPSHALVEEFMLAANEAVAEFLIKRHAGALFRVHEEPDPAAADALLDVMEELEIPTPPFPEAHKATAGDVAGALRRLSETLPQVSAREDRGRLAFPQQLLRSLKQARYDVENLGHFGLASRGYLHFTSPIRRYPDLVVHRALLRELGQGEPGPAPSPGELAEIALACSTMERTISKLELLADDIALSFLLERRLYDEGWEQAFDGEIIGVIESGVFVHFGDSFEGYLPARRLPGDFFAMSRFGSALVGRRSGERFRLGDAVRVCVERIDRLNGKVELALAGSAGDDDESTSRGAAAGGRGGGAQRGRRPSGRGGTLTHRKGRR